ncbi:TetR/AcrR family transcriptional regulator [Nocardioides sp.]|uniref:TetR/AcrR family transcriptional regulator n=1 Tax=Nocardioides sp. TaxID=35761 RepID=UPI0027348351|nr:TetR/AcrR family transcriptional regulator [Nocardioides sp.]MDP3894277.1 TetR/AcrR family transcriptional regulator [Nocardioides sp.]
MSSEIRERILDAAVDCLLESGLDARLHATIAARAGFSRPTLYKHVGDQEAILAAVREREIEAFFAAALPVLRSSDDLGRHLVDAVIFVVHYADGHALLQKALRDHPEFVLPHLTIGSGELIEHVIEIFEPQLRRALAGSNAPDLDPRVAAEWIYRIVISLIITPSTVVDRSVEGLREYVEGLLALAGVAERPATGV